MTLHRWTHTGILSHAPNSKHRGTMHPSLQRERLDGRLRKTMHIDKGVGHTTKNQRPDRHRGSSEDQIGTLLQRSSCLAVTVQGRTNPDGMHRSQT